MKAIDINEIRRFTVHIDASALAMLKAGVARVRAAAEARDYRARHAARPADDLADGR